MDTLICLDIDGTITEDKFSVPKKTENYLQELAIKGYPIFFETGRSFSFAMNLLKNFSFPYYISPQNGSVILKMPEKKEVFKKYLKYEHFSVIEEAVSKFSTDFCIYSGYENNDCCYYRKQNFSKDDLDYIAKVQDREQVNWVSVKDFDSNTFSSFPLIKGFGLLKDMQLLKKELSKSPFFQVSLNKDPFIEPYYLLLITHKEVSKGAALIELKKKLGLKKVVAAGDDDNDESMLLKADTKIVMETATQDLKDLADIIAPRPNECGIVTALKEVLGC